MLITQWKGGLFKILPFDHTAIRWRIWMRGTPAKTQTECLLERVFWTNSDSHCLTYIDIACRWHPHEIDRLLFIEEFAKPTAVTTAKPAAVCCAVGTQTPLSVGDSISVNDARTPAQMARANIGSGAKRGRVMRPEHRYIKCGKEFSLPEWAPFYVNNVADKSDWTWRAQSRALRNGEGDTTWDNCTVASDDYEDGFPVLDMNKRAPKRKKKRKQQMQPCC